MVTRKNSDDDASGKAKGGARRPKSKSKVQTSPLGKASVDVADEDVSDEDEDDDEKTAFLPADEPAAVGDDTVSEGYAFDLAALMRRPGQGTDEQLVVPEVPAIPATTAPETPPPDDDEGEKTAFLPADPPGPAAEVAPPALPSIVIADDDDEDKTSFLPADMPPASALAPSSGATVDDDDEDKTSFLPVDAPAASTASPGDTIPLEGDDDADKTSFLPVDAPAAHGAPGAVTPATPKTGPTRQQAPPSDDSNTGITGNTGGTDSRRPTGTGHSISAWTSPSSSSDGGTGPVQVAGKPHEGAIINQYELIRLLGEGGMGAVYLARDVRLGRRVAIKFLHAQNPELTERFVIEARATARVEHENIVSIYEVGEWGGSPYMVLQFLQGQELSKVIPRGKPMPVARVVELMTPVLRALDCAHGEGIVHRDLKPDNIFITDTGVTKVLDFGIAKVVQGDDKTSDGEGPVNVADLAEIGNTSLTRHGSLMGTMPYMSPEQWGNGIAIDHTTDIWAVGIMMYRMLSGKHPLYPLKGTELMVTGFVDEPMPSLREHAPDAPPELIKVIDKALAKVKSERWQSALAFLRALEPFQPGRYSASKSINVEESPYAGLAAFQEQDASRFFGRNREIAAMSQRLRECPLMAVVGSSGVGKSSFVRAGVVPALKNSGEAWDINVVRPGRSPLMALAGLLQQIATDSGSATSMNVGDEVEQQKKRAERLREEPGYFGQVLRKHARREKKKLLLFVDQFEELYTLVEDVEERLAFTSCLTAAADDPTSPMRVVVSIRSDFLDRCVEDVHFMNELSQGLFFMTAPTRDGMRDSLVLPAEMAGYKFESDAIVDDMLDHLSHTNGALPLLQFTADKLWSERDPGRKMLTQAAYQALGGVAGALASHADSVVAHIQGDQLKLVRDLFLRLVTPDRTRAIVAMDDLRDTLGDAADVQRLIDQLVAARLLVVQTGGGGSGATVELVHESLIHGWPQLRRWIDEGAEDAVFLEQLRNAARQWDTKGRDSGLLWRGEMAEESIRFVRRFRGQLPVQQQHFLKAVIDLSRRAARVKRTLLVVGSVVVVLLLAAAAVALYVINDARKDTERQAIAAKMAEKAATEAKNEAEERKLVAEQALADTKIAEAAREKALEAERKAAKEAIESKEALKAALDEAQASEKRATAAANEARSARAIAEQRAQEAIAARLLANRANADLQVAMKEVEERRRAAEKAKEDALKKLAEQTQGGVVEVLR